MGNPTLSLESYAPDVVEEETEEDLEDEINRDGVEDCNSIGSLREEGEGQRLSRVHVPHSARELEGHKAADYIGLLPNPTRDRCRGHSLRIGTFSVFVSLLGGINEIPYRIKGDYAIPFAVPWHCSVVC